jgi:hypothetical protein
LGAEAIRLEIQVFEASVKRLSAGIGQASVLWGDEKYTVLSTSISEIANQSKDVLVSGYKCCSSIDKFMSIANERY